VQRLVMQIAKKYFDLDAVNRYRLESEFPEFSVLSSWDLFWAYDDEELKPRVRDFAKEVVAVIRDIKQVDLIRLPTLDEAKCLIYDIMPSEYGQPGDPNADAIVENGALYMLEWLRSLQTPTHWRGRSIKREQG